MEALSRDDGLFIYCGTEVNRTIDVEVNAEGMKPWIGTVDIPHKSYVAHITVQLEPTVRTRSPRALPHRRHDE